MNKKIDRLQIIKTAPIVEAIQKLNDIDFLTNPTLFVVDAAKKVIGTLTDGDIRRAILKHTSLDIKVEDACHHNFVYMNKSSDYQSLKKFNATKTPIISVLSDEGYLDDIIDLTQTKAQLPLDCMIMAGGRGKRLSPLTDSVPKPMLLLGDKPIIEHNIDRLISFGVKRIIISVRYLSEQIKAYFGDGSGKGIRIEYIEETEPLGTAGALGLVEQFNTDHILLMNSDLFTNVDFESLYTRVLGHGADIGIASNEYKVDVPYAIFKTQGDRILNFEEKPTLRLQSNAGVYILRTSVLDRLKKGEYCDITDLMDQVLADDGHLVYDPIVGYWVDIGKPSDYELAKELVKHARTT